MQRVITPVNIEGRAKLAAAVRHENVVRAGIVADACCLIPVINPDNTTPHTEAFQAVVWHALVSHPDLKVSQTKWESVK